MKSPPYLVPGAVAKYRDLTESVTLTKWIEA
jgi:hypothetical protein